MPAHFGEMVLMVRTQDFASKNLHRIGQEMGKLNSIQRAVRAQQMQAIDTQKKLDRVQDLGKERRRLAMANRMAGAQRVLAETEQDLAKARQAAARSQPLAQLRTSQAHVRRLEQRHAQLTQQMKGQEDVLKRMPSRFRRLVRNQADLDEALEKNRKSLRAARFEARLAAQDYDRLTAAADPRRLRAMRLAEVSHAAGRAGRVAQLGGLVGTAALGFAASQAAQVDTLLTRAATQAPDTLGRGMGAVVAQAERFGDVINKAMGEFPATAEDMADALYNIFSSLDVTEDAGIDLFNIFNKLAVASGVDLPEAVNAGISVLEDFKGAQDDVNGTLNRMMAIVRFGRLDLAGFNTMLAKVGPAAAGANQKLDDVSGAMAFLATRAISPARGSTQLARLVQVFSDRDFIRGLAKAGVEITDANGQLISFDKIIEKIAKRWPELQKGEGVRDFFQIFTAAGRGKGRGREFTIEAQRAFTFLMTGLDRYRQLQADILADNDEFTRSYAAMSQSSAVQWQSFMNNAKRGVIALGDAAIPAFAEIGGVIGEVVDWWNQLDNGTQKAIGTMLTFVAVGGLVLGVLTSLIGFLGSGLASLAVFALGAGKAAIAARLLLLTLRALSLIGIVIIAVSIVRKTGTGWDWLDKQLSLGPTGKQADQQREFNFITDMMGSQTPQAMQEKRNMLKWWTGQTQETREIIKQHLYLLEEDERKSFERRIRNTAAYVRYKRILETTGQHSKAAEAFAIPGMRPEEGTRGAGREFSPSSKQAKAAGKSINWFAQQYDKMLKELNEGAGQEDDQRRLFETMRDSGQQAADTLKQAAARLVEMKNAMRAVNEEAFGKLFEGPLLSSEAFNLAKEWGIEPGMDHLIKDLNMQATRFKKWRKGIDALTKKGLPPKLVADIQAMGIEGMPFVETLISSSPGKLKEFIASWAKGQKLIDEATNIDFKRKMDKWRKFGKGIMQNIILGMQSEEVALQKYFENWINNEFPGYVKAMQDKARKEFIASQQAGKDKPPATPKPKPTDTKPATVTNNNQVTVTVDGRGKTDKEIAREVAWKVKNARRLPPGLRKNPDRR